MAGTYEFRKRIKALSKAEREQNVLEGKRKKRAERRRKKGKERRKREIIIIKGAES